MLTYGSNYGKRERLPGGQFEVYSTDMGGSALLLPYEDYSINPDILPDNESDWIEQALAIIEK